jgi:uncharacterized membrane protein YvbJ
MFCKKCGKQIDTDSKFCMYSGVSLYIEKLHDRNLNTAFNQNVKNKNLLFTLIYQKK